MKTGDVLSCWHIASMSRWNHWLNSGRFFAANCIRCNFTQARKWFRKLFLCNLACMAIIDSAPSLGVYYFLSLTLSVCLSVCLFVTLFQIDSSSLFLDRIEPFSACHFSVWYSTKRCSLNFDLLPWQRNLGYFCKNFKLLLLFCFSMESSHFLAIGSPWTRLQNVVLRFLI